MIIILCPRNTRGKISHSFAAWKSLKLLCCFRQSSQTPIAKFKLKAWRHNHSMSIFRPFFIFSRSDGQFVAIFPSNFPMTPRSASIHAWALNPARKKKKIPNFIPSKSLHFFAKSQPFGFGSTPGPPLPAHSLSLPALPNFGQPTRIHCELPKAVFQAPEHA